jgi:fibronectin type 3 domain-containing protein
MDEIGTTSDTYYYDSSPHTGKNYYWVTSVSNNGTESSYASVECQYSNGGGGGSSTISAPTGVSAEVSGSRVCVTWNSVSNASYYKVYRASSSSGSYSMIESSTSNTYYYDASPNTYNYYKVTAVNSSGTESEKSDYAYCYYSNGGGGGGGTTIPDAPTGVYAENIGSTMVPEIKITWNSVSNATSYKVYKSTSPNSGYTQHGSSITSTYCYDHSPSQGKNYYKVKAVNSAGESSYSSYAVVNINSNDVEPCPPTVSASGTSNSISVSWIASTSSGCGRPTSYEVHKYNPINSSWEQLTTTSSTSYTDRSPHPGVNRYIVKAINNYGEALGYGNSNSITLPKPTSFTAQKYGSDQVKLTWSKVNQATGYQIFWSTSAYGDYYIWEQVENVNTLIKYLPGASGTTTYFKIRAIWQADGLFEYSDFSSWTSVTF